MIRAIDNPFKYSVVIKEHQGSFSVFLIYGLVLSFPRLIVDKF